MLKKELLILFLSASMNAMELPKTDKEKKEDLVYWYELNRTLISFKNMSDERFDTEVRGKIGNEKFSTKNKDGLLPREIYIARISKEIEKLEKKILAK